MEVKTGKKNGISGYFVWIMTVMGLVHIIDVFVSNVGSLTTTAVAVTFFPELSLEDAVAKMTLISSVTIVVMLFQPIIKVMTDKYGRKPMILVTVLGMSLGNALQGFAVNFWMYVIGGAVAGYFLMADIQLLFIAEEAPERKRGFWILFTIFLGNLGTLLVPFARGILISDDFSRNDWHILYLISAALGLVLFVIMFFTMKESKAYVAAKEAGELEIRSGKRFSFVNAVRDLRKSAVWGMYRWYLLVGILFMIPALAYRQFTEPALSEIYTETEKNALLNIRIIFSVLWFLISGFLSDLIGRKKVLVIDQVMFLIGIILFLYFLTRHNIFVMGLAWGFMFAGTWGFMNLNIMATNEIIPTKLRATANGLTGFISIFVALIPAILFPIILAKTENFALAYYLIMPFTIILILVVFFKYKETKGITMEEIKE